MYSRLLVASALAAGLVASVNASDWRKDPDIAIDPSHIVASLLQLDAPVETSAEALDTVMGTGGESVGMDEASVPASSSSWGALFVDDDHLQCPNAMFTRIQDAVNASGPGATIKVCPGTYTEQVRIDGHVHDGLKLESLKSWQAIIKWPMLESFPLALVSISNTNRVTVRDFTISGPFTFAGCSPDRHEGVLVDDAFDAWILHNHVTRIQNSNPALFGCQEGDAVAIGRRTLLPSAGSARVEHNVIDEYQKNGVQVVNAGSSGTVRHNQITGSTDPAVQVIIASNGVVVFGGAAARVDHNVISNNNFTPFPLSTGIILDESPQNSSRVDHNLLFDNDFGIETDTQIGLEISHNDLFDHHGDAITLCGDTTFGCGSAMNIKVMNNKVSSSDGSGIALFGAVANLLKGNYVTMNGTAVPFDQTDGIRLDMQSEKNRLSENRLDHNIEHDCHDDSSGTGTGATANAWVNNKGNTANRPDLCRPDHF
jgi:parallel beta-helix repeat protein